MKRIHDHIVDNIGTCDEDWASLNGDLVRALACVLPTLLPSLYLVSKHYHTALALAPPNAPLWQAYFHSSPGYSDYKADADFEETWKDLVKQRRDLERVFYLHVQQPQFACDGRTNLSVWPCYCGQPDCGPRGPNHPIKRWVDRNVTLEREPARLMMAQLPVRSSFASSHDAMLLKFRSYASVGFASRRGGPSIYVWDPLNDCVWQEQELNSFTRETRVTLVAARKEDITDKDAWRVDRFVGII
jgi:hypothetical protein